MSDARKKMATITVYQDPALPFPDVVVVNESEKPVLVNVRPDRREGCPHCRRIPFDIGQVLDLKKSK